MYLLLQFSSEVAIRVRIRANIVRALSMHGAKIKKDFGLNKKKEKKMACRELQKMTKKWSQIESCLISYLNQAIFG